MPVYEYRCENCLARVTVLARTMGDAPPACKRCGGARLTRLLSRFASPRSEEARMEALADPSSLGAVDEQDPASVARWMRRLGRETGEDWGDGFEEHIEQTADEVSRGGDPTTEDLPGASDQ